MEDDGGQWSFGVQEIIQLPVQKPKISWTMIPTMIPCQSMQIAKTMPMSTRTQVLVCAFGRILYKVRPGIFFSKDRREEVIEVEEDSQTTTIAGSEAPVKLMMQGEWMKGCPEGSEQSFLFGLYSELTEGICQCPDCGMAVPRNKSDFFAIFVRFALQSVVLFHDFFQQPEFSSFIQHLLTIVRKTCQGCKKPFCFACGESINADKVHRPSAAQDDNPLFHCSNLQGVILGVGLFMLEQMFVEQSQNDTESKPRSNKRRKTTPLSSMTSTPSKDADDDEPYFPTHLAKGGIGYAGNLKEDVSVVFVLLRLPRSINPAELWTN